MVYGFGDIDLLLLEYGANINKVERMAALHEAVYSRASMNMAKLLVCMGADIRDTPLHCIAYEFDSLWSHRMVRLLVDNGADINAKNNSGKTFMSLAAYNGNRPIQRVFLDIWLRTRNVEQGHVQKERGAFTGDCWNSYGGGQVVK